MRFLPRAGAVTAVSAAGLLLAPTAYATPPTPFGPPGDNGTVKIHDAATDAELRRNEPHVCRFYLDAFGFDGGQQARWRIVEMPPTGAKGAVVKTGALPLDGAGRGRTEDLSLPDGHYKLIWNFDGEHGRAKHKVFWAECGGDAAPERPGQPGQPGKAAQEGQEADRAEKAVERPGRSGGDGAVAASAAPGAAATGAGPSAAAKAAADPGAPAADGDLAETGAGAPVGTLAAGAVALIGAGAYIVLRRRRRS